MNAEHPTGKLWPSGRGAVTVQSDIAGAEFRQPPHNLQLEQALMGAWFVN